MAGTKVDDLRNLENGNAKVLLGAFIGEISVIRKGLMEGGVIDATMDPFMGEAVLKLGKVFRKFPLAPALHLAIYQGDKKHFEAAFFMMNRGADINNFLIETNTSARYTANYPPGILYCLGLGKVPSNSHAAFLNRLHLSLPEHFKFDAIEKWRQLTGNPPLIQIAALSNFFDGVYVLVNQLKVDVNAVDQHNLTALHIAAWQGDYNLGMFLASNGADVMMKDIFGRTPFHYAAIRGSVEYMTFLMEYYINKDKNLRETDRAMMKSRILLETDDRNFTALDLAKLYPPIEMSINYFQFEYNSMNYQQIKSKKKSKKKLSHINHGRTFMNSIPDSQPGDSTSTRGGWDYFPIQEPLNPCPGDIHGNGGCTTIDVVRASDLSQSDFNMNYFSVQRPLLITGNLASRQGIWAYWQRDEFLKRYGNIVLTSGEKIHASGGSWNLQIPSEMTLQKWVEHYMSTDRSTCRSKYEIEIDINSNIKTDEINFCDRVNSIITSWVAVNVKNTWNTDNPLTVDDFKRPSLFNLCGTETDNEYISLHIGPSQSGIPLQSNSAHWNLLITGVKRWFLIPPGSKITSSDLLSKNGNKNRKIKTVTDWIKDELPDLQRQKLVSTVIQYPGDVVFVPHDWSYATLLEADSVSVSQQFCTLLSMDQRITPLGFIVYGGEDTHRGLGRKRH